MIAFSAVGLPGIGGAPASTPPTDDDPPWRIDGLPLPWLIVTAAVGALYVVLSWPALRNLFARRQLMNASFNRWQLANAYGAFGTVTKQRIEIVVEGTMDDDPDAGTLASNTHSRANPVPCAASRVSSRRTTCDSTG